MLKNKTTFNIITCIEDFMEIYDPPKSIGTDNGREFKNKLLSNFMNKRNIKFKHGLPYKSHSQGVCERIHRTINAGLIVKRIKDRNILI